MTGLFLLGPPKAGTSSLYELFESHPEIFVPDVKEPKFHMGNDATVYIDAKFRSGPLVLDERAYGDLYHGSQNSRYNADCTPLYLWSREAHKSIHRQAPDSKLIAVLRDPLDRAFSHWRFFVSNAMEKDRNFESAFMSGVRGERADWPVDWNYYELGLYGEQLRHILQLFPREQLHLVNYGDLVASPNSVLSGLSDFLDLSAPLGELPWSNRSVSSVGGLRGSVLNGLIAAGSRFHPPVPLKFRAAISRQLRSMYHVPKHNESLKSDVRVALAPFFYEDRAILEQEVGFDAVGWS